MASSSTHPHQNEEHHELLLPSSSSDRRRSAFYGIEPPHERRNVSESPRLYDVFINHRGPDVKNSLALQLYKSLEKLNIRAFLDSKEKELGDSFTSTIKTAIHSAAVHIAIFSKGYAESPWCLEELFLMLQTKAKIIPVFYDVEPSALRHIEKGVYGQAFAQYHEKGRYLDKLEEWKKALQSVSFIAGEEFYSSGGCENIVSAVEKEVERTKCITVAKYPVGLPKLVEDFETQCIEKSVQDFERQCQMNKQGEGKVKIVGIFGMGGAGKTTLSKELFNKKRSDYNRSSFLFDVREASAKSNLPFLQMKLFTDLFNENRQSFTCVEDGANCLRDRIGRSVISNFLIVLDDIDHLEQLDALCISDVLEKFSNCLVIVTTRDVGVLINAGITVSYHMKGMDEDDAKQLFCWHAFRQPNPDSGYNKLVDHFVDVCHGLPLSIQVLGSHVYGHDREFWELELKKVKKVLPQDILKRLRISIETLDKEEKKFFMDVACFFIGKLTTKAMQVWEASGWNSQHALRRLQNKCLVEETRESESREQFRAARRREEIRNTESRRQIRIFEPYKKYEVLQKQRHSLEDSREDMSVLRMHDRLRDLGREMADEVSNPRRLWRPQHLQSLESKGFENIITQPKFRCLHSFRGRSIGFVINFFLGEPNNTLEPSTDLLWLELIGCRDFPPWIPLQNLRFLKIKGLSGDLTGFWQRYHVQTPFLLKELVILEIQDLQELSLGFLGCLEKLKINSCLYLNRVIGISDLTKLAELNISDCLKVELQELSLCNLHCLEIIIVRDCKYLRSLTGLSHLPKLRTFEIGYCETIQDLSFHLLGSLEWITIEDCGLKSVAVIYDVTRLRKLSICRCGKIEELILVRLTHLTDCIISGVPMLKRLEIKGCVNLQRVRGGLLNLKLDDCPRFEKMTEKEDLYSLERLQVCYCDKRTIRKCLKATKKLPSELIKIIGSAVDGAESTVNANLFCGFNNTNSVIDNGIENTCNHLGRNVLGAIILCSVVKVNGCAAANAMNEFIKENECDLSPWLKFDVRPGEWIITLVTMREDEIKITLLTRAVVFHLITFLSWKM